MPHHNYKELLVWKKSLELSVEAYHLTVSFHSDEKYNLVHQIRKCAVSIPSNIAEGAGRGTDKDFKRFLEIALGSCNELATQLTLSRLLGLINSESCAALSGLVSQVSNMILALIKKLDSYATV